MTFRQNKSVRVFFSKMDHDYKSTLTFWEIKKGCMLEEHHHVHEQIAHIPEGKLQMKIGGEEFLFSEGMVHVIPSDVWHSAIALTDCKVIDAGKR